MVSESEQSIPRESREKIAEISFDQLRRGDILYVTTVGFSKDDFKTHYKIEVLGIRKEGLRVRVTHKTENPKQLESWLFYAILPGTETSKRSFFDSLEPRVIRASASDEKTFFNFKTIRYKPNGYVEARSQGTETIESLEIERAPKK